MIKGTQSKTIAWKTAKPDDDLPLIIPTMVSRLKRETPGQSFLGGMNPCFPSSQWRLPWSLLKHLGECSLHIVTLVLVCNISRAMHNNLANNYYSSKYPYYVNFLPYRYIYNHYN